MTHKFYIGRTSKNLTMTSLNPK